MLNVGELNALPRAGFCRVLDGVFEHSPWVVARTADKRPFADASELLAALRETVMKATDEEKLSLLRSHPDLVGAASLTKESRQEQAMAGLIDVGADERLLFQQYNARYRERFGFPFIICARQNKKDAILEAFPRRLAHSHAEELETALREVFEIAKLRLQDVVG